MTDEPWTRVRVCFAASLIEVVHLRPGQSFTLGEDPSADLVYPLPGLHRLVMATAEGAIVQRPDGGGLESVGHGQSMQLELGALSIEICSDAAIAPAFGKRPLDRGWWLSLSGSALALIPLLVVTLLAARHPLPPLETDPSRVMAYMVKSEANEPEDELEQPPKREERAKDRRRKASSSEPRWTKLHDVEPEIVPTTEMIDEDSLAPIDFIRLTQTRSQRGPVAERMPRRDVDLAEAARERGVAGAAPTDEEIDEFIAVAARAYGTGVDEEADKAMWLAMTSGPVDTTIGGLELTSVGRSGGGTAEGVIRSGAPDRPSAPVEAEPLRPTFASAPAPRARLLSTHVDGELEQRLARRFAEGLTSEWVDCLEDGERNVEFELRYTLRRNGKLSGVEVSRAQLSSKARRCVIDAIERSAGLGAEGQTAKVKHRVAIRR